MCAQGKPRLPASIAEKSREELQVYVVELLKKLKLRDKKIDGEPAAMLRCDAPPASPRRPQHSVPSTRAPLTPCSSSQS